MKRKDISVILADAELDEKGKIDQILALYHSATKDLKTEDDIKAAIADALKRAPAPTKAEETDEYKKLKKDFDDFKYSSDLKGQLKAAKVKDKFLDDVIAKIKREEKLDDQLPKIKESFGEYFDADDAPPPAPNPPPAKPVFSSAPKGGGEKLTPEQIAEQQAREALGLKENK